MLKLRVLLRIIRKKMAAFWGRLDLLEDLFRFVMDGTYIFFVLGEARLIHAFSWVGFFQY